MDTKRFGVEEKCFHEKAEALIWWQILLHTKPKWPVFYSCESQIKELQISTIDKIK